MKKAGIFILMSLGICSNAQNNMNNTLLAGINRPLDVYACYQPTPALVMHAQPGQVLFQSTDGGTTWMDMGKQLPAGTEVSQVLVKGKEIFLGTFNGKLYYTNDAAHGTWELQKLEGKKEGGFILNIYSGQTGTYACVYEQGLYKQVNGTNSWVQLPGELENTTIFSVSETAGGNLLAICETGIYSTKDEGKTWKHVFAESWVNNIVCESNVWLAYSARGIIRSVDNGEHWNYVLEEVAANFKLSFIDGYFIAIRQTIPYKTSTQYFPFVSLSKDGGITWQDMVTGSPSDNRVYDLEKSGDYLFSSREAGISRSSDLGKTWQLLLSPPAGEGPAQFEMIVSGSGIYAILKRGGC